MARQGILLGPVYVNETRTRQAILQGPVYLNETVPPVISKVLDLTPRLLEDWRRGTELNLVIRISVAAAPLPPGVQSTQLTYQDVNWRLNWTWTTVNYIGKDSLVPGQQYSERPALLAEDWRRTWEFFKVLYYTLNIPPGKSLYDLSPGQIPENWRRSWEWRDTGYIGKDAKNPGIQLYVLPPGQVPEDWRKGSEHRNTRYIGLDRLVTGKQSYDLPFVVIRDRNDRFWTVNLLENTLTLTPVVDLHFKPFHMTIGRLGNLGGLS